MKKSIISLVCAAVMLTLAGCSDSNDTSSESSSAAETTTTTAATTAKTTTTEKETEPPEEETETETETTTAPEPEEPETPLWLSESKELSTDDLYPEDKALFEDYIKKHGLKGKYYDRVGICKDTPPFYFIPMDILYELGDNPFYTERCVCIFSSVEDAYDFVSDTTELEELKDMGFDYVVLKENADGTMSVGNCYASDLSFFEVNFVPDV